MAQYAFGSGHLFLTRADISNPTPRKVGVLQECSVEFKAETKELFGGQEYPLDIASGKKSITWKAKLGQVNGRILSEFAFAGQTPTTGLITGVANEAGTVPASSAYTVSVSGNATFYDDLGVRYADTGLPLERVASAPATGQYSVSSGVYTFNSAQASAAVLISYAYTQSGSAPNNRLTVSNQDLGALPFFIVHFFNNYRSKQSMLKLYASTVEGLTMPFKMDDYMLMDLNGKAFANAAGKVFDASFTE